MFIKRIFRYTASLLTMLFAKVFLKIKIYFPYGRPQGRKILVISNHQSLLDPPFIGSFLYNLPMKEFAKKELFRHPVMRVILKWLDAIPVNREGTDIESLKKAISVLKNDGVLLIFPEGTRTLDGNMQPFKKGAAYLVRKTKCNVLPVYVDGLFYVFPKNGKMRLRYPVKIIVGKVHPYSEIEKNVKNMKDSNLLSQYLFNIVKKMEVENDRK